MLGVAAFVFIYYTFWALLTVSSPVFRSFLSYKQPH